MPLFERKKKVISVTWVISKKKKKNKKILLKIKEKDTAIALDLNQDAGIQVERYNHWTIRYATNLTVQCAIRWFLGQKRQTPYIVPQHHLSLSISW